MRAPPRRRMAVGTFRLAGMVRRVTGSAFAVPLQRDRGAMAVLTGEARARGDVDIVPERDVARARALGHLKVQRQPDRPFRRDGVHAVTLRARQSARRVVVTRGAVRRRAHSSRAMGCASSVTAAAGQIFVALVLEGPSNRNRLWPTRRAVLGHLAPADQGSAGGS